MYTYRGNPSLFFIGRPIMKNFSKQKQENQFVSATAMDSSMPPHISRGSFDNVRLGGRSVGASMILGDGGGRTGESSGSCSINIYVNNDIQGINNSVLIDSEVRMGDLGVSLFMEEVKMDRGFRLLNHKKDMDRWMLLVGFTVLALSILAYMMRPSPGLQKPDETRYPEASRSTTKRPQCEAI